MKSINKVFFIAMAVLMFSACDKVDDLPLYSEGVTPELTALNTTIAPLPADSLESDLVLNWSSPNYATDSSSYKYIIQIDSVGRNFAKAVNKQVVGTRTFSMTNREFNNILLGFGMEFNKQYDVEIQVISSYGNNNERRTTNKVLIKATPYKVPPKVPLPTTGKLYIVGDATDGGWNNPVPVPTQELTQLDETTFGGVFQLTGGKQYLILPANGSWDNKYSVASNSVPNLALGGNFGYNLSDNFPGPSTTGLYKIILDFQAGKFTVTNFDQQHGLPNELVIVGDATPLGWTNPVDASQQFTRVNSTQWVLPSIALTAGKKFLLLPVNGSWSAKYGAADDPAPDKDKGGKLKPEGADIESPGTSGNYKVTFDLINNQYKVEKQ
jgi:hypothetical protein